MHPDTKLGLALGMLVTGFAIAFCFPREPRVTELADEREFSIAPIEPIRFAVGEQGDSPLANSQPAVGSIEPISPPEPLPTVALPIPRPLPGVVREMPQSSQPLPAVLSGGSQASLPAEQTTSYRVQPNDTLSGIAARFLGSSQRYYEIYTLNRDQLPTPNDLKAGMTIRIPAAGAPEAVAAQQTGSFERGGSPSVASPDEPQPTLAIRNRHVVQPGETLESIATRYFGDRSFVTVLRVANPQLSGNEPLRVGSVIELPVLR